MQFFYFIFFKGSLGLIGDHRKFNVAVTRGKALCVLIGQPYLLYTDPVWREFLEYCDKNGKLKPLSQS